MESTGLKCSEVHEAYRTLQSFDCVSVCEPLEIPIRDPGKSSVGRPRELGISVSNGRVFYTSDAANLPRRPHEGVQPKSAEQSKHCLTHWCVCGLMLGLLCLDLCHEHNASKVKYRLVTRFNTV